MSPRELWDKRADSFGKRVKAGAAGDKQDYISQMLERIEVGPGWTVLDFGCGALDRRLPPKAP